MFKLLKKSTREKPKISLILLDWNVRDSFHICHYLKSQTVPRDTFEIVVIEYYSKLTNAVKAFEKEIDSLALLDMPKDSYYHKHLMYNVGFILSKGDVIVICDSDAMVKPTFIESILHFFEENPNRVLHLDQFRNHRMDLYPFCYPSFEEVTGPGCINYQEGKTTGVVDKVDRLHRRNYGSCFCCTRADYLAIGGSDEHVDFVGHICGPYDLTFRLINLGKEEVWHQNEFLYHTWHPGSDGIGEYLGPHDGHNLSTTSLEALWSGRVEPHVPHPLIQKLKQGETVTDEEIVNQAVNETHRQVTQLSFLKSSKDYAKKTYRFPLPESNHFSKWKKFQFAFTVLFQKGYALFVKKLPIWIKSVTKIFPQTKQQWTTLNQGTDGRMVWWEAVSRLYAQKKKHYIIVNSQRDQLIFSEFLLWKGKMSLRPHQHIQLLYLGDLDDQKIKELIQEGHKDNLHITRATEYDWKQTEKLKDLEFSVI